MKQVSLPVLIAIALAPAQSGAVSYVACDQNAIYSQVPTCPSGTGDCVIQDLIQCNASCPSTCTYSFGARRLVVQGTIGQFFGMGKTLSISANEITTGPEGVITRFSAQGGTITLAASGGVGAAISGVIMANGGNVTVSAPTVAVGTINIAPTNINTNAGTVRLIGNVTTNKTITAGPGLVWITGSSSIKADIVATSSGTLPGGAIQLDGGNFTITATLNASTTGNASTGDGGIIGLGPGGTYSISGNVLATSANGNGGTIQLATLTSVNHTSGRFDVTGAPTGGHIELTGPFSGDLVLSNLIARATASGYVDIISEHNVTVKGDIDVSSNKGPNGSGGAVYVDACHGTFEVDGNVLANGNGANGVGGSIEINAAVVNMLPTGGIAKKMTVNGDTSIDPPALGTAGTISIATTPGQFLAMTNQGVPHKIRAIPGGTITVTAPGATGGDFNPAQTMGPAVCCGAGSSCATGGECCSGTCSAQICS